MDINVVAAIIYKKDRFLIARRDTNKHLGGLWEFPGGKVEINEKPEEALAREIREELNIEVEIESYIGENVHSYAEKVIKLMVYKAKYISGNINLDSHSEYAWITVNEINNYDFAEADMPFIYKLKGEY